VPRPLTARQSSILDYISTATVARGVQPSYREIAGHFKITVGGLQKHLKALQAKGVLRRPHGRAARDLQIVAPQGVGGQVRLPVLGQVRAGLPVEAIENVEDHVVLDRGIAKRAQFALRISGDSMEPDIREGDLALIERAAEAANGDVVIAHVSGEGTATVKFFRRRGRDAWLEAANRKYRNIRGPFEVVGRVVGFVRSFSAR